MPLRSLLIPLLSALVLWAAPPSDILESGLVHARHFSDENGLPVSSVDSILLAPDGRVWAGTQGGALLWDGHHWERPLLEGKPNSEWILGFCGAPDDRVYLATQFSGVLEWNGHALSRLPSKGLPSNQVGQVLWVEGELWARTLSGLYRLRSGSWESVFGEPWTLGILTQALVQGEGAHRRIWMGVRGKGLGCYQQGTWRWFGPREGLPAAAVNALALDGDRLWIGTSQGLACLQGDRFLPLPGLEALPNRSISRFGLTKGTAGQSVLWIGTQGGVARWDGARLKTWTTAHGLPSTAIYGLQVHMEPSGQETLWMATQSGVVQLRLETWRTFGPRLNTPDPNTWAILEVPEAGALWFASSGLTRWKDGVWTTFGPREGLPEGTCFALTTTNRGKTLWVGTMGNGLYRLEGARFREVPGIADSFVFSLLTVPDPAGELLVVGARKGLDFFQNGHWRHMGPAQGFPDGVVTALAWHPEGNQGLTLWAAVRHKGLGCLPPGADRWTWFPPEATEGRSTCLRIVTVGGRPELWMGSWGGIRRFAPTLPFRDLGTLHPRAVGGAPIEVTFSLQQGPDGTIYAFTQKGVVRLSPQADGSFAALTHSREDGLPSVECQHGSSLLDSRGRIWAGTVKGPAVLDPARFLPHRSTPPLAWRSLRLDEHPPLEGPALSQRLRVPWQNRRLRVSFSQLALHRGDETRYQTFLEGLDLQATEWSPVDFREFTVLPPGVHRLEVRARDFAGNLSQPISLELEVEAPPWLRAWAFAIYALTLGGGVWGLVRWREARLRALTYRLADQVAKATSGLREKAEELEQANRHLSHLNDEKNRMLGIAAHDLRSPLGLVDLSAQVLLEEPSPEEVEGLARNIRHTVAHLTDLVHQILDSSLIEAGSLNLSPVELDPQELVTQLLPVHEAKAEVKRQRVVMESGGPQPRIRVDALRLRQILDNLISNALKFMPPGGTVRVRLSPGLIEVEDEGPGFSAEDLTKLFTRFQRLSARPTGGEATTGLGLSIVKELVEAMGGSITLVSEPDKGARFILKLPLA